MNKVLLSYIIASMVLIGSVKSQGINLSFTAQDSITAESIQLDSVVVYNITSDCDTVVYGPDPVLALSPVNINENARMGKGGLSLSPPFPNPSYGTALIDVLIGKTGPVDIYLYDLKGTVLYHDHILLDRGQHQFKIESSESTVLFVRVSTRDQSSVKKLINMSNGNQTNRISYHAYSSITNKAAYKLNGFIFYPGDELSYTCTQQGYKVELSYDSPHCDTSYTFALNLIDGFYIVGASTAYQQLNANALMLHTPNEVNQQFNPDLYELYIPVMEGMEGFNIIELSGNTTTTYGPDVDFLTIISSNPYEPQVPFQRGSYKEDANVFTVTEDRMYHVAIFTFTKKAVIVPVHWGMIGPATLNGWGGSVAMEESTFDLHTMSWTIDDIMLYAGDWKYRYSDGWKVYLDETVNIGGTIGVAVNANFGGTIENLIPGGPNIVNIDNGIYSSTLEYTLGSGYNASLIFVDSLPNTNWTGVQCDAVGTGISPDNPTAMPDPSSWAWGYRIIADNGGVPTALGAMYTWTWTSVILEAYEGFKLRTLDGLPSPLNGIGFDVGYSSLNIAASSPNIINNNGNLMATVKAAYTIVLHVDAANSDAKEIIITMD